MPSDRINNLYQRLDQQIGLPKKYVKEVILPAWWEDSLASSESGFLRAAGIIASHTRISLEMLADPNSQLRCEAAPVCFKRRDGVSDDDVAGGVCIALAIGRLVCKAINVSYKPPPSDPSQIRRDLRALAGAGEPVGLSHLLSYLWQHGIPVVHAAQMPPGKFDGIALSVAGRPVILVAKGADFSALIAFILAHELGHIVKRHLAENGIIVDKKVQEAGSTDPKEVEANAVALEALTGKADTKYKLYAQYPVNILKKAQVVADADKVDVGIVIMNDAFHCGQSSRWRMSFAALKKLPQEQGALVRITARLQEALDLDTLHDEDRDFLERVIAPVGEAAVSSR